MKKIISFSVLAIIISSIGFYSCSKEVESMPQYIFKKAPNKDAAAKFNNVIITKDELFKGIESDLYEAEMKVFDLKMNKFKALILEKLMTSDPRKKGLTNDQFLEKYISSKINVSKKEMDAFIKERKIPKPSITKSLKERIKQFLIMNKKKSAVEKWTAKKLKNNKVEVYLEKPTRPVFSVNIDGAPFKGNNNAKVTLVEFSDFQCPYCARGRTLLEQLRRKYGKKLKIVFKQYPLPFHNHAQKAAEAALCAFEQGTKYFWSLHDKMFDDQTKLDVASLKLSAKSVGINSKKFNSCLDTNKMANSVKKSIADGQKSGVKSTPTFLVNGQLINGAQPIEIFTKLIDSELKK